MADTPAADQGAVSSRLGTQSTSRPGSEPGPWDAEPMGGDGLSVSEPLGLFFPDHGREAITSPEAAARVLVPLVWGSDRERCVAAYLDTRHRLIGRSLVSVGSQDHTFVQPREILREALLANASALVVAHNHPSGDPDPSEDDRAITRRLVASGETVGVEVLDHLVIGGDRWVSLARKGVV